MIKMRGSHSCVEALGSRRVVTKNSSPERLAGARCSVDLLSGAVLGGREGGFSFASSAAAGGTTAAGVAAKREREMSVRAEYE